LVQIGNLLNHDHSAVRYGIGQHCRIHGLAPPCGCDLVAEAERKRKRNAEWHRRNGR
jgi:hypothetical protein